MKISNKYLLVAAVATVLGGTDAFARTMPSVTAAEQGILPAGIEGVEVSNGVAVVHLRGRAEGERVREGIRNIGIILANPDVYAVTLRGQYVNDDETEVLVDIVNGLDNIVDMSLMDNNIGVGGAIFLARLRRPIFLRLNHNHIGNEGAQALIGYLRNNPGATLALPYNELTPDCVQRLENENVLGLTVGAQ